MDTVGGFQVVKAHVPQKELYRYSTTLRSLTEGRGIHTEEFSHYEEMPRRHADRKVVAAIDRRKKEERIGFANPRYPNHKLKDRKADLAGANRLSPKILIFSSYA